MNSREANEYIDNLIQGITKAETEFEGGALNHLRRTVAEERELKERIDFMTTELESLKSKIQTLNGRREAYLQILIDAEMKRRALVNKKVAKANPVGDEPVASEVIPCNFQKKGERENAQEGR